jgi:hypothetical protein
MTTIAEIEKAIADLGYGTEEYHEALGMYCMMLARSQWRLAEYARSRRVREELKSKSPERRKEAPP